MKQIILLLLCGLMSCRYEEVQAPVDEVLKPMIIDSTSFVGDGISRARIQITFPPKTPREKTAVEFRTTAGLFDESDKDIATVNGELVKQLDGSLLRVAQVTLIAPQKVGKAEIIAKSSGYIQMAVVVIKPACAEKLVLFADKVSVKSAPDSEIKFTAQLLRETGKPSLEQLVELKVTDAQQKEVGQFREVHDKSDADGKTTFSYTLGSYTSVVGTLTATASYTAEGGKTMSIPLSFTSIK